MTQGSLFDQPEANPKRQPPPAKVRQRAKDRILELLRDRGEHGATDEEMQIALKMPGNTQRPKRIELWKTDGLIADSGRKRTTEAGEPAHVWVLAKYANTPAESSPPKPATPAAVQKPLPIDPDKARRNKLAADREERLGPILDAMPEEELETLCRRIFPAWPCVFGPYPYTPASAQKDKVIRKLLLVAIADSHGEDCRD